MNILTVNSSVDLESVRRQIFDWYRSFGYFIVEFGTQEPPSAQLLCFRALFGKTVFHDRSDQDGIAEVSNVHQHAGYLGTSNEQHYFHTDGAYLQHPPRVVLLRCEIPSLHGGETIIATAKEIVDCCFWDEPEVLGALCRPDTLTVTRANCVATHPVFSMEDEGPFIRYRSDFTASPSDHPLVKRGFELIRTFLQDQTHVDTFTMLPRQVLVMDNWKVLHGRTAFPAGDQRMLHRLFLDGGSLLEIKSPGRLPRD